MTQNKTAILFATLLLFVVVSVSAQNGRVECLLELKTAPCAWYTVHLDSTIATILNRDQKVRVNIVAGDPEPTKGDHRARSNDIDSLIEWGRESRSDFLVQIDMSDARMEGRKSFNVPLLFHKYEMFGIIAGEMRIIDVQRGRLICAEPFLYEQKGPRIIQPSFDDDRYDPDLHLTPMQKTVLFQQCEKGLSKFLSDKIKQAVRKRHGN